MKQGRKFFFYEYTYWGFPKPENSIPVYFLFPFDIRIPFVYSFTLNCNTCSRQSISYQYFINRWPDLKWSLQSKAMSEQQNLTSLCLARKPFRFHSMLKMLIFKQNLKNSDENNSMNVYANNLLEENKRLVRFHLSSSNSEHFVHHSCFITLESNAENKKLNNHI